MTCCVLGCPRKDVTVFLIWVGGERIAAPVCPPHEGEYLMNGARDVKVIAGV